jgi:hypothetical protein
MSDEARVDHRSGLITHAVGHTLRHSDSAALPRRPAPVEQFVVSVVIEGECFAAVGAGDNEDAVAAHLAQLGDITK